MLYEARSALGRLAQLAYHGTGFNDVLRLRCAGQSELKSSQRCTELVGYCRGKLPLPREHFAYAPKQVIERCRKWAKLARNVLVANGLQGRVRLLVPASSNKFKGTHGAPHRKHDCKGSAENQSGYRQKRNAEILSGALPLDLSLRDEHDHGHRVTITHGDPGNPHWVLIELRFIRYTAAVRRFIATLYRNASPPSENTRALRYAEIGQIVVIEQQERLCDWGEVQGRLPLLEPY